jgi:hypothetical protein
VIGGLLVALAIVIALPMSFLALGAIFSAIIGWLLKDNGEASHEGSELIDLNK